MNAVRELSQKSGRGGVIFTPRAAQVVLGHGASHGAVMVPPSEVVVPPSEVVVPSPYVGEKYAALVLTSPTLGILDPPLPVTPNGLAPPIPG